MKMCSMKTLMMRPPCGSLRHWVRAISHDLLSIEPCEGYAPLDLFINLGIALNVRCWWVLVSIGFNDPNMYTAM